jgi:hypothetical protein
MIAILTGESAYSHIHRDPCEIGVSALSTLALLTDPSKDDDSNDTGNGVTHEDRLSQSTQQRFVIQAAVGRVGGQHHSDSTNDRDEDPEEVELEVR